MCQIFKGLHAPRSVKSHCSEREVMLARTAHTRREALPPSQVCYRLAVFSQASHCPSLAGQAGAEKMLSTQALSLLPHESGLQPGSQGELLSGCDSQQVRDIFPQGHRTCLQFSAPLVPSAVTAGHLPR